VQRAPRARNDNFRW